MLSWNIKYDTTDEIIGKNMSHTNQLEHLLSLFHKQQFSLFDEEAKQLLDKPLHPLVRAKVLSWYAQSQLQQHKRLEAIEAYKQAIQEAKTAEDNEGVLTLKEQYTTLLEQQKAANTVHPKQTSDPLQAGISQLRVQNTARAETLLLSSVAQADEEGDPKGRVLSRLALARIPTYQKSMIEQALEIAQQAGDMNLITAVKKTMDQMGESIPPHIF